MGTLANCDFVKMNGLGNEIVIVDLRRAPSPISAAEARAAARQEPYDQLMALYPAQAGSDASVRIFNNDGSEAGACGNGMRCVAALVSAETGHAKLTFETPAGLIPCWRTDGGLFTVDMGQPHFRWNEIPLAREMPDTRAIDLTVADVPDLRSPSVVSMAIRTRSSGLTIRKPTICAQSARGWSTIRCFRSAPISRWPQRRRA